MKETTVALGRMKRWCNLIDIVFNRVSILNDLSPVPYMFRIREKRGGLSLDCNGVPILDLDNWDCEGAADAVSKLDFLESALWNMALRS